MFALPAALIFRFALVATLAGVDPFAPLTLAHRALAALLILTLALALIFHFPFVATVVARG